MKLAYWGVAPLKRLSCVRYALGAIINLFGFIILCSYSSVLV
jgi:hypothetical protein